MKVLHLASFDRWSGAAAPAFVEADALRAAGVDAEYAFVGGYLLEEKLRDVAWAHPLLRKGEGPLSVVKNVRALRRLITVGRFDLLHAHLTYDHWLARLTVARRRRVRLVRTFHSGRSIRHDRLSRRLVADTAAIAVVNPALSDHPALRGRPATVTPPPVEPQYVAEGDSVRAGLGVPAGTPVIGAIGKISPGRGFEDAIEILGIVRTEHPDTRLLIIGKGPHQLALEKLASTLDLTEAVIWAGYHEEDLPARYRAMDVMLFTGAGSDEGHRAITEANASGVPVAAYPLPGVEFVIGESSRRLVSDEPEPLSLATIVSRLLSGAWPDAGEMAIRNARRFDYGATVDRLLTLYRAALRS